MTSNQLKESIERQIKYVESEIVAREAQYDAEFNADGATFDSRKDALERLKVDKNIMEGKIKFLQGEINRVDSVYKGEVV